MSNRDMGNKNVSGHGKQSTVTIDAFEGIFDPLQ